MFSVITVKLGSVTETFETILLTLITAMVQYLDSKPSEKKANATLHN